MSWWHELKYLVRKLDRKRAEQELDEEIRTHLELEARERIEDGLSSEDSHYAAHQVFGSVALAKEGSRAMWGIRSLEILMQDLRYGVRMLVKKPGFTLIAVLTLALGIGVNTTVFTYVNAVLFRLLTFAEPERVTFIWGINTSRGNNQEPVSAPEFKEWREQSQSFETMVGITQSTRTLTGVGEPERISSAAVSADYFQMLGVEPFRGRWFLPNEDKPGAIRVAVLNYYFWRRRFGAHLNVLGQTILLDGDRYSIIGIAPREETQLLVKVDLWEPLIIDPKQIDRAQRTLMAVGRLKPGVTVAQANAEMENVASRIAKQYPATNAGWSAHVRTAPDQYLGAEGKIAVALLVAVVFCVLMIACFNVAGMQLVHALARQKEIAIRLTLGAGRWRLIRQFLTENLLIALLGGATGLVLSLWGMSLLHARYAATSPFLNHTKVDGRVLTITTVLALLSAIVCGVIPIWQATKPDLFGTLKEGGRSLAGNIGNRMRNALVVAEISLSLILLIVSGLMIRSIISIQTIEPGFDPNNLLTARITLPQRDYPTEQKQRDFFMRLMAQIVAQPGIKSAGAIDSLPLTGNGSASTRSIAIEGRPPDAKGQLPWARILITMPGYFDAIGIPLLLGRSISAQDGINAQPVALINQAMAQKYWPDDDPIGKRIKIGEATNGAWVNIVGIVGNVRDDYVDAPPSPQIYLPYAQRPVQEMSLVVRTTGEPLSVVAALRNIVWGIDRNLVIYEVHSMRQRLFNDVSTTYLVVELLGVFAFVALILSAVGIYGIIAYSVSQRTREIGIRIALGAQTGDALKLILRQGLKLTATGLVIGLPAAFALTRLMESLLVGVSASDLLTFVLTSVLIAVVALLACWVPARRATKVDPMIALRCE